MTTEPRGPRCTAVTEFGRCGYPASSHKRHRAKTAFGEMEWEDDTPAGTGSPTPAPDVEIDLLENTRRLLHEAVNERDEARAALAGEQLTVAEVLAVCQRAEAARDAAESALAALRTEVGEIAEDVKRNGGTAMGIAARLRALVADQSPAAPANAVYRCHCGNRLEPVAGVAECAVCKVKVFDFAGLSPTSDTQTSDGGDRP